jgi:hypothetical protein
MISARCLSSLLTIFKAFGLIVRRINDEPFDVPSVPGSRAVTIKFMIPNSRMGSVIGKQGSKIKEIQDASGARLNASEGMLPGSTEVFVLLLVASTSFNAFDSYSAFSAWQGLQMPFISLPTTLVTSLSKPKKECLLHPTLAIALALVHPPVVLPIRARLMYRGIPILMAPHPRPSTIHLNNYRPNKFTSRMT